MLVDYSSSESSSEDDCQPVEQCAKRIKLPSAADLLNCQNKEPGGDDPDRHGGRIRSFAHERGIWASYCYFKLRSRGRFISDLQKAIQEYCQEADFPMHLECIEEPHLSLTKTFILRHHWIESFIQSVRDSLAEVKMRNAQLISFGNIRIFENEDKTRTFIALGVNTGDYPVLQGIVAKLDYCLQEFNLPPFYEDPDYHASFLWCLGSHGHELRKKSQELNEIFQNLIKTDELTIECDSVDCKIGNKLYKFPLI